jgi:protein-tyrosine phosphatase
MINVLCLCLGNICRSPLAEGILKSVIKERGLDAQISVDSAGTNGYHDGEAADPRSQKTAQKHGLILTSKSRQITAGDYSKFDYILVMDDSNRKNVQRMAPNGTALPTIYKIRAFDNVQSGADVDDPYYGGQDGFDKAWDLLKESSTNFVDYLIKEHGLEQ